MAGAADAARETAERLLADALPMRWSHVRAVGAKAERVASILPAADRAALVAAAWQHDIGYAPDLVDSGFHPLDGARWLRGAGLDPRVARLVANHSFALVEAELRGLADALLAEFPAERSELADMLVYCDLTTAPDGRTLDVEERLAEITTRYGSDSVVGRFVAHAENEMIATVRRIERRLGGAAEVVT
ncbi:MAG TPA: HD domain-containing protein [Micromonosporaceae bacterium]